MKEIVQNLCEDSVCRLGYQNDSGARKIKFIGYKRVLPDSTIYIDIDSPVKDKKPLNNKDLSIVIDQSLTSSELFPKPYIATAQLVEIKEDKLVSHSKMFVVQLLKGQGNAESITPDSVYFYTQMQELADDLEEKRDNDYWRGPKGDKGDAYVITNQDKIDIANDITNGAKTDFKQYVDSNTAAFNENAREKTSDYNSNATAKTQAFNSNANNKTGELNSTYQENMMRFLNNAVDKTKEYNDNATSKLGSYDYNAIEKLGAFNFNASSKTTSYNENATSKVNEYNSNASAKVQEYNQNAQDKINYYDEHVHDYETEITELNDNLTQLGTQLNNRIDSSNRDIQMLKEASKGKLYTLEQVDSEVKDNLVPSGSIGARVLKYEGQSIVWNQLVDFNDYTRQEGNITVTSSSSNKSIELIGTTIGTTYISDRYFTCETMKLKHKYYIKGAPKGGQNTTYGFRYNSNGHAQVGEPLIISCTGVNVFGQTSEGFRPLIFIGANVETNFKFKPRLIDLTKLFGSSNEPTSVDDPKIKMVERILEEHPEYCDNEIRNAIVEMVNYNNNVVDMVIFRRDYKPYGSIADQYINWSKYYKIDSNKQYEFEVTIMTEVERMNPRLRFEYTDGTRDETENFTDLGIYKKMHLTSNKNKIIDKVYINYGIGGRIYITDIRLSEVDKKYINPIPTEITQLDGYGISASSVHNEVDLVNKKFIKRVGSVDLGTLEWRQYIESNKTMITVNNAIPLAKANSSNIITSVNYEVGELSKVNSNKGLWLNNTRYTDVQTFKQAMQGVMLYYELETPIEIDISQYLDDDFLQNLLVESNGQISFENDNQIDMPNSIEYAVKLSEV